MALKLSYQLTEHKVKTVTVDIHDLRKAEGAQRTFSSVRARQIARGFQLSAMGTVTCSQRADGFYYMVDGQHRVEADKLYIKVLEGEAIRAEEDGDFEQAGKLREKIVQARLVMVEAHVGITEKDEATLFLIKNKESSRPGAVDQFIVGKNAGLEPYVETWDVFQAHGLSVEKDNGVEVGNLVTSVVNPLAVVDRWGKDALGMALDVAEAAWGTPSRTRFTWNGTLIGGLGMLYGEHGSLVNTKLLIEQLRNAQLKGGGNPLDPQVWMKLINTRATSDSGYTSGSNMSRLTASYLAMREAYNYKLPKKQRLVVSLAAED